LKATLLWGHSRCQTTITLCNSFIWSRQSLLLVQAECWHKITVYLLRVRPTTLLVSIIIMPSVLRIPVCLATHNAHSASVAVVPKDADITLNTVSVYTHDPHYTPYVAVTARTNALLCAGPATSARRTAATSTTGLRSRAQKSKCASTTMKAACVPLLRSPAVYLVDSRTVVTSSRRRHVDSSSRWLANREQGMPAPRMTTLIQRSGMCLYPG